MKRNIVMPLDRTAVEMAAKIIGPNSACAGALRRAGEIGPTAKFWSLGFSSIIVTDGVPTPDEWERLLGIWEGE